MAGLFGNRNGPGLLADPQGPTTGLLADDDVRQLLAPSATDRKQALWSALAEFGAGLGNAQGTYGSWGGALNQGLARANQGFDASLERSKQERLLGFELMPKLKTMRDDAAFDAALQDASADLPPGLTTYGRHQLIADRLSKNRNISFDRVTNFAKDGDKLLAAKPEIFTVNDDGVEKTYQRDPATGSVTLIGAGPKWNPKPTTVINNNVGGKAFAEKMGELDAKTLSEWRERATGAQDTLTTIGRLKELEGNGGVFQGTGGDAKLVANNVLTTLGLPPVDPSKYQNSQEFQAQVSKLLLDRVRTLGANPSEGDRIFLERTLPNLGQSAEARKALYAYFERQANAIARTYGEADKFARQNNGLGGFNFAEVMGRYSKAPTEPSGSGFTVTAPNGKTYAFKSKKDADNFRLSAGIR